MLRLAADPLDLLAPAPCTVEETPLSPRDLADLVSAACEWRGKTGTCTCYVSPRFAECAFLDSALADHPGGRWSVLGVAPRGALVCERGRAELHLPGGVVEPLPETGPYPAGHGANLRPFDLINRLERLLPAPAADPGLPLGPLAVGWLGYDLGRWVERLPERAEDDHGFPDLRLAVYERLLVADAHAGRVWAVGPRNDRGWWRRLRATATEVVKDRASGLVGPQPGRGLRVEHSLDRQGYTAAVRRALDYIAAGDVFQLNIARRVRWRGLIRPVDLYRRLRAANPAPYAALLAWGEAPGEEHALLSSSPELFLERRGSAVLTRPIKGTRPRGADEAAERAAAAELLASDKERAELAMIVDLLRNDLGRTAVPGSVRVTAERELERFPGVLHTVATVGARLPRGLGSGTLLASAFPGGSITGAPKVRAMEIIEELEPVRRGPYTGCVGWLAGGGRMAFNIAIRTLTAAPEHDGSTRVDFHVGAGIVADSDPEAEYLETQVKAERLLRALGT